MLEKDGEFCSLSKWVCSFSSEMTKMALRELTPEHVLTHASVNLIHSQHELTHTSANLSVS